MLREPLGVGGIIAFGAILLRRAPL